MRTTLKASTLLAMERRPRSPTLHGSWPSFLISLIFPMLVVFDRVVSLNANWPKKWLLHAIDEPLVNGTVTGVEVPDKIVRYAGDLVTISHNDGKLFSQTLLPASATIRKVGGTGYEFWVDDPGIYPLIYHSCYTVSEQKRRPVWQGDSKA